MGERSVRTIHWADEQVTALLDKIDGESVEVSSERRTARYAYRVKALVVHMQQPGSSIMVAYLVPTRNICNEGIAFFHGGFVHIGTRCVVQLITTYGTWDNVPASVIRCRYIEGSIHEVAVKFDRVIDPSVYCMDAIRSRVLLVDDDASTVRLATLHLEKLHAKVDHAENGQEAVELAMQEAYDFILMDFDMPGMDGLTATKELRKRGYRGMIIAATAMTQEGDEARCLEAGCDKYLPKPYTRDDLNALLQSLRKEPLFSTFVDDPSMVEMIDAFVSDMPACAREIEDALAKEDLKALEHTARDLKGKGSCFGFEMITDAAVELEKLLVTDSPKAKVETQARSLLGLCMQARASGQLQSESS